MGVNVLLITHEEIGEALLRATTKALGTLPLETTVIGVGSNSDPDFILDKLQEFISEIELTNGLLILTDLFGSTPSNIAASVQDNENIRIISGLNLPMLIKVMNYAQLNLSDLSQKAYLGGREGVINCIKTGIKKND